MSTQSATGSPPKPQSLKRVLAAGFLGTTVEYYDFFIYGTAAALVFPTLFFPELGAAAGIMASFATFGVAFVARPLGGIIFGHIGDRVGRKTTLVMTLLLMGGATVAIGLLPGGAVMGVWAPILLVTLRFLQGLAVGGEWSSAALFVGEYAPKNKRAFYALSPTLGTCAGLLLSTMTFLITGFTMSNETFMSWGWRLPFLFSIVLVAVGLFVRLGIAETPPPLRGSRGRIKRAAGAVLHRVRALFAVTAGPACGCRHGNLEPLRGPTKRLPVIDYTSGQLQPALGREKSIRVGHEDLRLWNWTLDKPHSTRRSSFCHLTTPPVTNLRG